MDANEIHTFIIGFAEGFCLCKPQSPIPPEVRKIVKAEYHYYRAGVVTGKIALACAIIGIILLGKVVLL